MPKYEIDPIVADLVKEYQPGIQPEFYYKKSKEWIPFARVHLDSFYAWITSDLGLAI